MTKISPSDAQMSIGGLIEIQEKTTRMRCQIDEKKKTTNGAFLVSNPQPPTTDVL